jgi:hypothetical protein
MALSPLLQKAPNRLRAANRAEKKLLDRAIVQRIFLLWEMPAGVLLLMIPVLLLCEAIVHLALEHFRISRFLSPRVSVVMTAATCTFRAYFPFLDRTRIPSGKVRKSRSTVLTGRVTDLPNLPRVTVSPSVNLNVRFLITDVSYCSGITVYIGKMLRHLYSLQHCQLV